MNFLKSFPSSTKITGYKRLEAFVSVYCRLSCGFFIAMQNTKKNGMLVSCVFTSLLSKKKP
jgi:hypothetical protein